MDKEEQPLESSTRTFDTTRGKITYAELSDLIAPKLLSLLDDINDGKYRELPFDEELILNFHKRMIGDIMPEIAGIWRKVLVGVGNWIPPEPHEVPMKIREYVQNVQTRLQNSDTVDLQIETLAYAEGEFLHIHPFQDFNGRTVRIILAELLGRFNLPPVDVYVERNTPEFKKYQNALAEYDNGRPIELIEFWQSRFSHSWK